MALASLGLQTLLAVCRLGRQAIPAQSLGHPHWGSRVAGHRGGLRAATASGNRLGAGPALPPWSTADLCNSRPAACLSNVIVDSYVIVFSYL